MPGVVRNRPGVIDAFAYKLDPSLEGPAAWHHTALSNGYIEPDGSFVEREYHAARATHQEDADRIMACTEPFGEGGSKKLGRAVPHREDWEEVRYQVMLVLVVRKFLDHPELAAELLGTGEALLVEGNTWHDQTWGDCRCGRPECAEPGLNLLGQILMSVREMLRWQAQA